MPVRGIPDERLGETVVAVVRPRDDWQWEDKYEENSSIWGPPSRFKDRIVETNMSSWKYVNQYVDLFMKHA